MNLKRFMAVVNCGTRASDLALDYEFTVFGNWVMTINVRKGDGLRLAALFAEKLASP